MGIGIWIEIKIEEWNLGLRIEYGDLDSGLGLGIGIVEGIEIGDFDWGFLDYCSKDKQLLF